MSGLLSSSSGSAIWVQNLSSDPTGLCGQRRDAESRVATAGTNVLPLFLREGRVDNRVEGIALISPSAAYLRLSGQRRQLPPGMRARRAFSGACHKV